MTASSPILVIHQGALGDLILSLPALNSLHLYHKGAPWIVTGHPPILSLLQEDYPIYRLFSADSREWGFLFREGSVPRPLGDLLASCRRGYLFSARHPDPLLRGLERAGMKEVILLPSFPAEEEKIPLACRQKPILESLGIPWVEKDRYFRPSPTTLLKALRLLKECRLEPKRKEIWMIHPGSGSRSKNWPWPSFLQTAHLLREQGGLQPLILFGPVEAETASVPPEPFQEAGFPILKSPPLPILAALLSLCQGYLGNDSGVSHLAAAVGTLTLAIFGPTDPLLWGPRGLRVKVLSSGSPCAPCTPSERSACRQRICLEALTVSRVVEAILGEEKKV